MYDFRFFLKKLFVFIKKFREKSIHVAISRNFQYRSKISWNCTIFPFLVQCIWPDHLGYPLILTYYDGVVGLRGCLLEDIKRFFCYYEIFPMRWLSFWKYFITLYVSNMFLELKTKDCAPTFIKKNNHYVLLFFSNIMTWRKGSIVSK